nr:PREDICTED: cytochrome c oxidase assembly protein COX16 homolog, mitochondrial [Bemisia tabaci]
MKFPNSLKIVQDIQSTFERWNQNKFFRYAAPFVLLVVGSSFALKNFTSLRYEYRSTAKLDPKEFEAKGIKMKPPGSVTLESEYEKLKELDLENWEQVRGPRPYEDPSEFEETKRKQQEKRAAERQKKREQQELAVKRGRGQLEE